MAKGRKVPFTAAGCPNPAFTYFVRAGKNGPVKIGATQHLRKRMQALQNAHYEELIELASLPHSVYPEEAFLYHFQRHQMRGEWFHPAPELLEIAEVAAWRSACVRGITLPWPEIVTALKPFQRSAGHISEDEAILFRCTGQPLSDEIIARFCDEVEQSDDDEWSRLAAAAKA